nr:hypothetical protein [uncultured bacterium]
MLSILMFIVIFVTLLVIAVRVIRAIIIQSEIFDEFGQSKALLFLVPLYPVGPLLMSFGAAYLPVVFVNMLVACCYTPGLVVAKRQNSVFERAGTSRGRDAKEAVMSAFSGALIGIISLSALMVLSFAFSSYSG